MTTEIFKDIIGYEGIYQISNLGNVKRLYKKKPNGIILKPLDNGAGYCQVGLSKNNKSKKHYIHRLLAQYFIHNPNNFPCINHINGLKNDNRIDNLEWCTYSDNNHHAIKTRLRVHKKGDDNTQSKKIINIQTGEIYHSALTLSLNIGVSRTTLHSWLNGNRPNKTNYRYL
jgi:hypothetical protein